MRFPFASICCLAIVSTAYHAGCDPRATSAAAPVSAVQSVPAAALRVWGADDELAELARRGAERIRAASGLVVELTDDPSVADLPLVWSSRGAKQGWWGWYRIDNERGNSWIMLDESAPKDVREGVMIHELLHALGAPHVEQGAGVMSPNYSGQGISAEDLAALCTVAACTTFVPEA